MYDIISAILAINSDAQVSVAEEDFDQITWHAGTAVISKADIVAKQAELKTAYDANEYQRQREPEYPEIGEQLDLLWHAIDDGTLDKTSDFYTSLKATKDKYPKP
tara:strand:+ start:269 stop:583 length:315 start_codon:yes stop_codon:yes gene_type:complete